MKIKHLAFYFGLLLITALAAFKPNYNWDCLPYMAIVLETNKTLSPEELHREVYNQAKQHIPAEQYNLLVANKPYRIAMQHNAMAFYQQLPFYRIKPLYIALCALFYKLGVNIAFATVIPSLLAFFGIGVVLFFLLKNVVSQNQSMAITYCLLLAMPFTGIGRESSPDAISCFLMLLGCYWFFKKKCWHYIAPAFALAVLARPDNIIFVMLFGVCLLVKKYWSVTDAVIVIASGLLAYFVPQLFFEGYNWKTLFYHSFIKHLTYPKDAIISLTITDYIFAVLRNAFREFNSSFIPLLLIFIISIWNYRKIITKDLTILWLSIGATIIVRYLLFPVFTGRFMAPYYLIAILLIINQFKSLYRKPHEIN